MYSSGKMKNKLYYIRTQRGFTLKDLSEQYTLHYGEKISPGKFAKIEEDKTDVPLEVYLNLADLFDVTLDFMLNRTDAPDEEVCMRRKEFRED